MIFVCANCDGASELADAIKSSGAAFRLVGCMNACASAPVMSVHEAGREAYLFGPVGAEAAADVPAFIAAYRAAPNGRIADATGLPVLRHCLIGRVPTE